MSFFYYPLLPLNAPPVYYNMFSFVRPVYVNVTYTGTASSFLIVITQTSGGTYKTSYSVTKLPAVLNFGPVSLLAY
jgi:hypothetical protein